MSNNTEKTTKELAILAAEAAEDKKANDVQVLDVKELTIIADYFVICSGNSEPQVKAIARSVEDKLGEEGIHPQKVAGKDNARWILMDYADVIVHIFLEEERQYYELERLWADAEQILRKGE
ncbi:ribosome silencing factor [Halothermothrix orenii]|uniref:Ribosomal silencing factor RsfS n=1 Tax=Halothermothrix orenii (strain H 168 / OCM 544 / DSM 9562) TaxID=373903 RepID=B8CXR9_HALOH|nr:ribosome silencing factor [Halothermothrix orenii]ACL70088.1 iojap-like protein [Halothermothrix orenii H 168]